jgi:hypothetical protein
VTGAPCASLWLLPIQPGRETAGEAEARLGSRLPGKAEGPRLSVGSVYNSQ